MNWRSIWTIAQKDLKDVRQNKAVWMPALIIPIIFAVVMPLMFVVLPQALPEEAMTSEMGDMEMLMENMPPALKATFDGLSLEQIFVMYMTGFMLAPMFLIMPLMFSSVIGSDSFVGERERKTMEALLYTPTSDRDLFMGKVLAALLPAVGLSWLSFVVYGLVVNLAGYPLFGRIWFPLPAWWPLMFWLTPAVALMGISATVLISSRVKTFMEAYQLSGSLVVLVLALVIGQVSGVLFLGPVTVLLMGAAVWLVDALLIYISVSNFKRSALIAQL